MPEAFWEKVPVPEGRFLTGANLISLGRIPLSAGAAYFVLLGSRPPAGVFILLAAASDWLDGRVARSTGTVSDWGRILDPLADKISFGLLALALVHGGLLKLWILLAIAARDLVIGLGGLLVAGRAKPPSALMPGKVSTCAAAAFLARQALFPEAQLIPDILPGADILGVIALASLLYSFVRYLAAFPGLMEGGGRRCA
jgi:CDP-diacylglycerol--glycerol-3-phosphate 3-phosphatidyltransferase